MEQSAKIIALVLEVDLGGTVERFTQAEFEVMRILWESGELKPQEILDRHPREISNSTLRTFLADLVSKGHVSRVRKGKAYLYRARTRPASALRSRLRHLVDVFFGGSTAALAKQLVSDENLSAKDLEELQRMVEEARRQRTDEEGLA